MKILVLFCACLILTAAPVGESGIPVCGTIIHIGMDQTATLRSIAGTCSVKRVSDPRSSDAGVEAWSFTSRQSGASGEAMFDGNERLMLVSRLWSDQTDAESLVAAAYFASKDVLGDRQSANCTLKTEMGEQHPVSVRMVVLTCGAKELVISGGRGVKGFHAESVSERLLY